MKNTLLGHDLVTVDTLTKEDVGAVFSRADKMKKIVEGKGGDDRLKGKILAALFYEPSSRTFSSFISSMQRLGGGIIPLSGMANTSVVKGETLEDTVRVFSQYADILVIRHKEPGSVKTAAKYVSIPVVNAGDGINEHPTQALIDLFTIKEIFGRVNNFHILLIGDLGHYRPVNSLVKLLTLYKNIKISLASPKQVPIQDSIRKYLQQKEASFEEYTDFDSVLPEVDILYVTRVKKEYMTEELYRKIKGSYIVDKKMVKKMKKDSVIMHVLPRVDEIDTKVDSDERAIYMNKQIRNGLYIRMALLDLILRK